VAATIYIHPLPDTPKELETLLTTNRRTEFIFEGSFTDEGFLVRRDISRHYMSFSLQGHRYFGAGYYQGRMFTDTFKWLYPEESIKSIVRMHSCLEKLTLTP
jgi:hypothetical protein